MGIRLGVTPQRHTCANVVSAAAWRAGNAKKEIVTGWRRLNGKKQGSLACRL